MHYWPFLKAGTFQQASLVIQVKKEDLLYSLVKATE